MKNIHIKLFLFLLICIAVLVSLIGCSPTEPSSVPQAPTSSELPTYAKELLIFAAAGIKPPIDEVSKIFEQKYGSTVTVNYGGGGEVLSSMLLAKKGDMYIAPEQRFMDSAKKQGAIDSGTMVNSLAFMVPVIGVKKGNPLAIKSLSDLAKPDIEIAMGSPETTLLGMIGPEILKKAGLYSSVQQNIVTNAPQVTAIITMLKMSQVDAGFIWHYFGTTSSNDIEIVWIPREYVTGIGEIQAAVSTYSKEPKTAQQFINLLMSSEGKDIFKKFGYIVDRQEANKYWQETQ